MIHRLRGPALDCVQALRLRHIQRAQDKRVQYPKNHGVRTDCQRERHNGDEGESWRLAQFAKAETQVVDQNLKEVTSSRFVTLLFDALISAELDARATLGFRTTKTRALEII